LPAQSRHRQVGLQGAAEIPLQLPDIAGLVHFHVETPAKSNERRGRLLTNKSAFFRQQKDTRASSSHSQSM
jgi:hypothetical protein